MGLLLIKSIGVGGHGEAIVDLVVTYCRQETMMNSKERKKSGMTRDP